MNNIIHTFLQIKSLPSAKLQCISDGLREYVKMMLNATPELRPDAHQFIKVSNKI